MFKCQPPAGVPDIRDPGTRHIRIAWCVEVLNSPRSHQKRATAYSQWLATQGRTEARLYEWYGRNICATREERQIRDWCAVRARAFDSVTVQALLEYACMMGGTWLLQKPKARSDLRIGQDILFVFG